MAETFTVLAVCTGNICRSPAMERLLAQLFADEPAVRIISGGTHAHDGEDMQGPMKRRVADYGADVDQFVAEQLTAEMIQGADLIVAATRVHVDDMLAEVPGAADKTFTLPEFGRLLAEVSPAALAQQVDHDGSTAQKLAALVRLANDLRHQDGAAGSEDEIVDPYMLPDSVYDESFRQIREPVEVLARTLSL